MTDQWGMTEGWETLRCSSVVQTWVRIETVSHGSEQRSENPGRLLRQAGLGEGRGAIAGCRVCYRQRLASALRALALAHLPPPHLGGAGVL